MTKSKQKRWVVKVGSRLVYQGGPLLVRAWMQQVVRLRDKFQVEVIWVSSGAIAIASDKHAITGGNRSLAEKQALSALGQPNLMDLYNLSLGSVGCKGAQLLLTEGDIRDPQRCANLKATLHTLLEWGAVPIINENDTVATEEIQFGDNDRLSALIAGVMEVDRLVVMTDVPGLFDKNPAKHADAKLVTELERVTANWIKKTEPTAVSEQGTGGMYSKLIAAKEATESGIETWLIAGDVPNILLEVAQNRPVGTRIKHRKEPAYEGATSKT